MEYIVRRSSRIYVHILVLHNAHEHLVEATTQLKMKWSGICAIEVQCIRRKSGPIDVGGTHTHIVQSN